MKILLYTIIGLICLYFIIYGIIFIMSFTYQNCDLWVSVLINLGTLVGVVYFIELSVKKIDKHNDE